MGSYPKLVVGRAWDVAAPEHLPTTAVVLPLVAGTVADAIGAELRTVLGAFNLCLSHPSLFFDLSCTERAWTKGLVVSATELIERLLPHLSRDLPALRFFCAALLRSACRCQ